MQKFFVSLLSIGVLGLSVFAAELPKNAKLPDGQVVAVPTFNVEDFSLVEYYTFRREEDKKIVGFEPPESDIVLARRESYGDFFDFHVYYALDTKTPTFMTWTVSDPMDFPVATYGALVLEDGSALGVLLCKVSVTDLYGWECVEGNDIDLDPIFQNENFVGVRAYVKHDGKRIAERVFRLEPKETKQPAN